MKYFETLPKVVTTDNNSNSILLTNLLARASVVSNLWTNPLLYYSYDLQDGDTPEIVAHKYYGDMYRYWIVLTSNQLLDPQWDWPMSGSVLNSYLINKYGESNIYGDIHHYEQILTQVDNNSGVTTILNNIIGENEYNNLLTDTTSYTLPTGTVTVTVSKRAVTVYEYELELNESKRTIKLLNKSYVNQFESEFVKLMK
jgi:hypothetical protein